MSVTNLPLPTLAELGAPSRFSAWRRYQEQAINRAVDSPARHVALCLPTGAGKCFAPGTPVLMYDGSIKSVEDVVAGDRLMGDDSTPRTVLSLSHGHGNMYEIVPTKGSTYKVNEQHVLTLKYTKGTKSQGRYRSRTLVLRELGIKVRDGVAIDLPMKTYLGLSHGQKHILKQFRVGVKFSKQDVPVDPYFIGLWLGDGCETTPKITTAEPEVVDYLYKYAAWLGLQITYCAKPANLAGDYALTTGIHGGLRTRGRNPLLDALRELGISSNKHIPTSYLHNTFKVRTELLAGLIDSDGSESNNGYDFVFKSEELARGVTYLCRSLGLAAYMKPCRKTCTNANNKPTGNYFRISVSGDTASLPVRVSRKKSRARLQKKDVLVTGIKVKPAGSGLYFGFELDGNGRFLLADFTVVHNSALAIAIAMFTGARTVYLTSTKALQDQIEKDFNSLGLVDVRGEDNYQCLASQDFGISHPIPVSSGPCHAGVTCPIKESTCTYYKAVREARQGKLVITNYAYWMYQNLYGTGLGQFDLMVLDEVHAAGDEVASILSTTIHRHEVEAILNAEFPHLHAHLDGWKKWADVLSRKLDLQIGDLRGEIQTYMQEGEFATAHQLGKRLFERKDLKRRLDVLAKAQGKWVAEMHGQAMTWDCIWPAEYVESTLLWHVPRTLLMSATVRPKTLQLLGIPNDQYEFIEFPSTFPVSRRPIYHIPTVRLNKDSSEADYRTWVQRIDQIIGPRLDRKGIIHVVSYNRMKFLIEHSEYRRHMLGHTSKNTRQIVDAFKKSKPPAILVSPCLDTGYDFPHSDARFCIVGKLPWPDTRPAVIQARKKDDDGYLAYLTMQSLVQMCGRIVRAEEDWGEVFICDDNFSWAIKRYKHFVPAWFLEAIRWPSTIPEPLKL